MADFSITGEVKLNSDPAEKSISKWTVTAGQLIADFAKKAASSLQSVVKSGLSYNAQMESYLTNFKVMLGDEQLAAEKLEEIRKMAASTPFSLSNLTEGTQTLLQFGIAADDTTGVLKQLGDISLGNADKMQTLVRAYGKMSSAQKVTLENVNMMIDAGFNPLNQICDATGESMTALYKRISDGKVGFEELQAAVSAATSEGGQFYNGMLEASQTFNGRLSTLTDNTKALLGKLSDSFYSSLSDLLPVANDAVLALTDALSEGGVPAMLETAGSLIDSFAAGIVEKIPDAIESAIQLATELSSFLLTTGTDLLHSLSDGFASGIPEFLASALPAVLSFTDELRANFGDFVSAGIDLILSLANGLVEGLPELFAYIPDIVINIAGLINDNAPKILAGAVSLMVTLGKGLLQSIPLIIQNIGKIIEAIVSVLSAFNWLNLGANLIKGIANGVKSMTSGLLNAFKSGFSSAISWIQSLPSQAIQWGKNLIQSFIKGMSGKNAASAVSSTYEAVASADYSANRNAHKKSDAWALSDDIADKAEVNALRMQNLAKQTETATTNAADRSAASAASAAASAAQKAASTTKKAAAEVVKSISDTTTELKDGVTKTTETVTETLSNGTTQQKQTITTTSREMVNGVLKDIKTVETIGADGKRTVSQTMETVRDLVSTVKDSSTAIVDGVKTTTETVTKTLADGTTTTEKVITQTQDKVIDGALKTVETVKTIAADGTEQVAETIKDSAAKTLDGLWSEIKDRASEGILGTVDTLWSAVKSGDWMGIGKWAASALYSGMTADQKQQLTDFALNMVDALNAALSDASVNLAQQAVSIGQSLFDGITGKFGDIMTLATKMGGTLKSTFSALAAPLSAAAKAISAGLSGGLLSAFPAIYAGFAGMISTIGAAVEGMLAAVSAALSATIFGIPAGVVVAAAAVALGVAIAAIVSKLGGSHSSSGSSGGGGGGSGSTGLTTDMPSITDDSNKLMDSVDANTAKLTEINKSLTKLVKSANALVLSDNMAVSSRVAASGTANIAAAARSYTRQGDTNITQNIYSKAQTAADQQREARWEADRARAQQR